MRFHPPRPLWAGLPSRATGSGATPMRSCSTRESEGSAARVHVGPVAHEDRIAVQEDRVGLVLLEAGDGPRRHPIRYHAARGLEPRDGLWRGDGHFAGVVGIEHPPARAPDKLQAVHDAALVIGPLEDEAVPRARLPPDLLHHLLHLRPRLRGLGEAGLLQEILAVVEHPGVGEPRHAVYGALVGVRVYRGREVGLAQVRCEEAGEVGDPTVGGELGWPDDVAANDVSVGFAGLELDAELLEVLARIRRRQAQRHLYLPPVLLVEPEDLIPQDLGVLPVREDDPGEALALLPGAPRDAEERRSGEPRSPQPEEAPAAQKAPVPGALHCLSVKKKEAPFPTSPSAHTVPP